ncbi:MAG TPA: DUF5947 family protein [Candidatus Angelobacter sp.]|nr:DUF5947 family protein [Candidatus Angelobacter sp.]
MTKADTLPSFESSFGTLRQLARRNRAVERCELCGVELGGKHAHLIELALQRLLCACAACTLLLTHEGARYKLVPQRVRYLPNLQITDSQWDRLLVPINIVFFFWSSQAKRQVAMYPSPAGATESQLPLETWDEIAANNSVLSAMEPDVEALLANRIRINGMAASETGQLGEWSPEYYLAPMDECYRLVGLIRRHWKGLSGGTEVWHEITAFFSELKARSVA